MLHIRIDTIPHEEQRYPTVGDYVGDPHQRLYVSVSHMEDCYKEFLVALHEQIEYFLCRMRGIKEEDITNFDLEYEARREADDKTSEPGDSELAPYRREHIFATQIEKLVCRELGLNWEEYEKTVNSL